MSTNYAGKHNWYQERSQYMLQLSENLVALVQTNRQYAFDRHICNIPGKGYILNQTSAWWFNKIISKSICNTHYIYNQDNIMFVKPSRSIPLEIIVKGYIADNTHSSINYRGGTEEYHDIHLNPEYTRNERLETPIVLVKDKTNLLISSLEIIEKNILTFLEWELISKIVLKC